MAIKVNNVTVISDNRELQNVTASGTFGISITGTANNVTGVVAPANGGTGVSTITGILKGNGTSAVTPATANTDYLAPALANTAVTGFRTATFSGENVISTTSGAITLNWSTAQNQRQAEPIGAISYSFIAPPGPCHLQLIIDSDGSSTAQVFTWPASIIWLGSTWAGVANKKAVINFWYDGSSYFAIGSNQV
jgi:hypothetical protein